MEYLKKLSVIFFSLTAFNAPADTTKIAPSISMNPGYSRGANIHFKDVKNPNTIKRGVAILFKYPRDETFNFFYRIVGLPGDQIEIKGTDLLINGKKLKRETTNKEFGMDSRLKGKEFSFYIETLDNNTYVVAYDKKKTEREDSKFKVKEGMVFVLGDNRDYSADSRIWGMVPLKNILYKSID